MKEMKEMEEELIGIPICDKCREEITVKIKEYNSKILQLLGIKQIIKSIGTCGNCNIKDVIITIKIE